MRKLFKCFILNQHIWEKQTTVGYDWIGKREYNQYWKCRRCDAITYKDPI